MAISKTKKVYKNYTKTYRQNCFNAWYSKGRLGLDSFVKEMDEDEYGRTPSLAIVMNWRHEDSWDVHADDLDAKAEAIVDDELVNHRVLMLKQMASKGKELQKMGIEWIRENKFDTSSSAVSAIFKGAELERTSRGISERLVKMLKMSDETLLLEAQKLLEKASDSGEIIDMEAVEVEDDEEEVE